MFNEQSLTSMAWAFATVGGLAPTLLDPISVLDAIETRGAKPQVMHYLMLM